MRLIIIIIIHFIFNNDLDTIFLFIGRNKQIVLVIVCLFNLNIGFNSTLIIIIEVD